MTSKTRIALLAAVAAIAVGAAGCSTVNRVNPFHRSEGSRTFASQGERIPVIFGDDTIKVSDALKGQDFYLPAPTPVTSWPLPGGPIDQPVENLAAGKDFSIAWRRGIGEGSNRKRQVTAPPVAADGKVFTMDAEATVTATDAQTGQRLWSKDLHGHDRRDRHAFGGGIAYAGGKLFVTSGFRLVTALDANSGAILWQTKTDTPIHGAPSVVGNHLLAIDLEDQLFSFDTATGAVQWNYQALVEPARLLRASSPAVTPDGEVVAAFASGELVSLLAANGTDLWTQSLSRSNRNNALSEIRDIAGRPVIYKGDVFASSHSGVFADIDLRTGGGKWILPVASLSTPWPVGDVVYVVSKSGQVVCAARESGQIYWITDLNASEKAVKPKGKTLGIFPARKAKIPTYWAGPVLASGRLIVVSSQGQAVALDPKSGKIGAALSLGGPALMPPIAMNGMLYLVTDRGDLVAIR